MSNKTLSNAELELTQRIQMHFPKGIIPSDMLGQWNSCPTEILSAQLIEIFSKIPKPVASPKTKLLLEPVGTTKISATTERFVASEKFVVNTGSSARVKICALGGNFENWFLNKIEKPTGETTLRYQRLRKASRDIPIINELGGEEKAETTLTEVYALMEALMELQKSGKKGALLTNYSAKIFYVRDINGILRAVIVHWTGWLDGWHVSARVVGHPHGWYDSDQVFSRNC